MSTTSIDLNKEPALAPDAFVPSWLKEDYTGDEEALLSITYSYVFWERVAKMKIEKDGGFRSKPEEMQVADWWEEIKQQGGKAERQLLLSRQIAESLVAATLKLRSLKDKSERASVHGLTLLKNSDRFKQTGEFDDWKDFLSQKIISTDSTGEIYELQFLVESMLPTMEMIAQETGDTGFKTENILAMQNNFARTKEAIPAMREAERRFEMKFHAHDDQIGDIKKSIEALSIEKRNTHDSEKARILSIALKDKADELSELSEKQQEAQSQAIDEHKEFIVKVVEVIADPTIPRNGINGIRRRLERGKVIMFHGEVCNMEKNTYIILKVSPEYVLAVEHPLESFVDFHVSDLRNVVEKLQKLLK